MHHSIDKSAGAALSCAAFTLLEMILSVALTGILAVAAFTLTNGAIQMGAEVGDDQKRVLQIRRCLEVFRSQMESLPGNARFELLGEDAGTGSLSELRIYDVPELFQVGGASSRSDVVSIISENLEGRDRNEQRGIELSLRYDVFGESESEVESRYLPLMVGLAGVEWRFYSQVDEGWLTEWEENQGRPRFIELNLIFDSTRSPIRTVFWLPPVANPRGALADPGRRTNQEGQGGDQDQEGQDGRGDAQPDGQSGEPVPAGQNQVPENDQNRNANAPIQ